MGAGRRRAERGRRDQEDCGAAAPCRSRPRPFACVGCKARQCVTAIECTRHATGGLGTCMSAPASTCGPPWTESCEGRCERAHGISMLNICWKQIYKIKSLVLGSCIPCVPYCKRVYISDAGAPRRAGEARLARGAGRRSERLYISPHTRSPKRRLTSKAATQLSRRHTLRSPTRGVLLLSCDIALAPSHSSPWRLTHQVPGD